MFYSYLCRSLNYGCIFFGKTFSSVIVIFFNRLELEDMEIKQNSAIKQLMREFNTQMALKEKELEGSIKETIGKKQRVLKSMNYRAICYYGRFKKSE